MSGKSEIATSFSDLLGRCNDLRKNSVRLEWGLKLCRAFLIATTIVSVWGFGSIGEDSQQALVYLLSFIACVLLSDFARFKPINEQNLLLNLDMENPSKSGSPYKDKGEGWKDVLTNFERELRRREKDRLIRVASTLVIPLVVFVVVTTKYPFVINATLKNVQQVVARLTWGANLKIISGKSSDRQEDMIKLTGSRVKKISLLEQNMIEIELRRDSSPDASYVVELKKASEDQDGKGPVYQSFLLSSKKSSTNESGVYRIAFSVSEHMHLYIPSESKTTKLAELEVLKRPVPDVSLSLVDQRVEPWPDDKPLALRISVRSKKPLQTVKLMITSGKRTSTEAVKNIMAADIDKLDTIYNLLLEPYVSADLAEVEIVAVAVDRSIPAPLIGYSEPIKLKTASAYGRYRETLATLRQIKELTDRAREEQKAKLEPDAKDIMAKVQRQASDSPFFDQLDRVAISGFDRDVSFLTEFEDPLRMLDLSEKINDFLFEHEMLDDRERDRDFFVAVRSLSRLIEQPRNDNQITPSQSVGRIQEFVDERRQRWQMRTKYIPREFQPPSWNRIKKSRPFRRSLEKVANLERNGKKAEALTELTRVASDYREWIEELEAHEDKARSAMERKRQRGLANAREMLKELQRRQSKIIGRLDRADLQKQSDLRDEWPTTRMEQNTNLRGTKSLEAQLRSLSPGASERIKLAAKSMDQTLKSGNGKDFQTAETAADMAGRLLQQAQRAAQKSQQGKNSRGRRRRVPSDRYYGQSVGGDIEIKREYQVDKRYREEILDEVRRELNEVDATSSKRDRQALENYLRKVVR